MHSVKFTFFLCFLLFGPFILRRWVGEPYPAIFLPEGATVIVKKGESVSFEYKEIYGLNEQKEWKKVDAAYLLSPIRMKGFDKVLFKQFDSSYSNTPKYKFMKRYHLLNTSDHPHSGDKWFIDKLSRLHLNPYAMRIIDFTGTVNLKTGEESNKIANEQTLQLHK